MDGDLCALKTAAIWQSMKEEARGVHELIKPSVPLVNAGGKSREEAEAVLHKQES